MINVRFFICVVVSLFLFGCTSDISVNDLLGPVNQWQPTGLLEKDNGMVKVNSNGYSFYWEGYDFARTVKFTYDYWLDTAEVTQKEFRETIMAMHPNFHDPHGDVIVGTYVKGGEIKAFQMAVDPIWDDTIGFGDSLPAYNLSWFEAILYCNARSKQEGLDTVYSYDGIEYYWIDTTFLLFNSSNISPTENVYCNSDKNGYRLPTEAEWDYACRAGNMNEFIWGSDENEDSANVYCWYEENSEDTTIEGSSYYDRFYKCFEVGIKKPNRYGLYDIQGNISEFCHNIIVYNSKSAQPATNPFLGSTIYPENSDMVVRGGNISCDIDDLRTFQRTSKQIWEKYKYGGIRCVRIY